MRQIPGVGSFVNWFSPPLKDPKKGRTFDLSSGSISTSIKLDYFLSRLPTEILHVEFVIDDAYFIVHTF